MQKTILAVSALAALVCLSAFVFLEETTSPAHTQAPADTTRFIAKNKFIAFFTYQSGEAERYGEAYRITSEAAIPIGPRDGALYYNNLNIRFPRRDGSTGTLASYTGDQIGTLGPSFPKGYRASYMMKYELTQGQYADFLNLLTPEQVSRRTIHRERYGRYTYEDHRGTIREGDARFAADRSWRACNGLSYLDGLAYADWAGLRPATELEWEKAARGPEVALPKGYPWGEAPPRNVFRILNPDGELAAAEDGTEVVDGNALYNLHTFANFDRFCGTNLSLDNELCRTFEGGDEGKGPVRVGVFGVDSGGDRVRAGASYYGVMEMGGNVQEPIVGVGSPGTRRFEGTHGDGLLTEAGDATNPDWSVADDWFSLARGGWWGNAEQHMRLSDRFHTVRRPERRTVGRGFRGVRSAPSTDQ